MGKQTCIPCMCVYSRWLSWWPGDRYSGDIHNYRWEDIVDRHITSPVKEGGCIINTCTYMHTHNLRVVWRDDRRSTVSSSYIVSAMENHAYSMGWVSWQHKGLHGHSIVQPACSRSISVTVCVVWLWRVYTEAPCFTILHYNKCNYYSFDQGHSKTGETPEESATKLILKDSQARTDRGCPNWSYT